MKRIIAAISALNSQDRTDAAALEKDILGLMGARDSGAYEITVENGSPTPLFNIIKTVDGKLEVKTPEGETKSFSDLTKLERKLIQHDIKTRREFWGKQIG